MAQLKNTLSFDLDPGETVVLTHGLVGPTQRPLQPDHIHLPSPALEVVGYSTTTITIRNNSGAPIDGAILVEWWHTFEREFGGVQNEILSVSPYISVGSEPPNLPPQPPFSDAVVEIFANATGDDDDGDGSEEAPYRTLQRAAQDVPTDIPAGVRYDIDVTGLGQETLPDGYCLPAWKSSYGFIYDVDQALYNMKGAVNIFADPQLASNIPAADAVIQVADLVPTEIGNGITNVEGFNDVRAEGTGDDITDEGDGIAKLVDAATEFDPESGVTFITIAGATTPANNGTFPVVGYDEGDPTAILYENPAVVTEAYAGAWEAFVPFVLVETTDPHGLWHSETPFQTVTIAGVLGSIGAVTNGDQTPIWRTVTTFTCEVGEDATGLVYGGGGTVEILFVQDPDSGNVQIKTNKTWPVGELAGKLLISGGGAGQEHENAVIWDNTADTLYISNCFAPGAFGLPVTALSIMEQTAELLTTCTFARTGSRRGFGRGGFTAASIDSLTLSGIKVTPLEEGQLGLCQIGGTLITQGCHLTASEFRAAATSAMSMFSYMDNFGHKGSSVDLDRCVMLNLAEPTDNSTLGWFYAYFGTVFHNVTFSYDAATQLSLFACFFYEQGAIYAGLCPARTDWDNVGFRDIDDLFVFAASSAISRNAITRCGGTAAPGVAMVAAFNGGTFLIRSNTGPYGDASFYYAGDFMAVDGVPERTFEDFRQHALIDLTPLTANFDTVFEAISPFTSTPFPYFGDPPYPSIEVVGDSPPAGGVTIDYDDVTGVVTIHFEDGVSTVLDAEDAVDNFAWPDAGGIRVKTAGTAANVLAAPGDEVPETALDPGVNGPCGEYTNIRYVDDVYGSRGTQSTVIAYSLA